MSTKDLGLVTAYGYAKDGGYTGTEAQFRALLANVAIDLAEIENLSVTVTTLSAGSDATASYDSGVLSLGIPRGDTGEISEADLAEALADYTTTEDLEMNYAVNDGYYEDLSVGNAEQIISSSFDESVTPYLYRQTGGGLEVGDRSYNEEIIGGTVAWNQLVQNGNFAGTSNWSVNRGSFTVSGNKATLTSDASRNFAQLQQTVSFAKDHVYLFSTVYDFDSAPTATMLKFYLRYDSSTYYTAKETTVKKGTLTAIYKLPDTVDRFILMIQHSSSTLTTSDKCDFSNVMAIDLTALFGSAEIADYVYSLEQTASGSGVAWLRNHGFIDGAYRAYDSGSLQSVKTSEHRTVGFNQWDEEWEVGKINDNTGANYDSNNNIRSKNYIPIIPNTTYREQIGNNTWMSIFFYDKDYNFIPPSIGKLNGTFDTPSNAHYMRFRTETNQYPTTYNHDICINISKTTGSPKNGDYVAYDGHSYSLDSDLELRGLFKLDANNNLYADGDVYPPSGEVERKYGIVDLGTLTWRYDAGSNTHFYATGVNPMPKFLGGLICPLYTWKINGTYSTIANMEMCVDNSAIAPVLRIKNDTYTDATDFKTAMSGVYLVYELATPTTETADPYQRIQIVDNNGTEEYVDTRSVPIPVGHRTNYPPDLKSKLESAPDSPYMDGLYLLKRSGGNNTYTMLVNTPELPSAPSEDGTYILKCTVSDGASSLSWESEA